MLIIVGPPGSRTGEVGQYLAGQFSVCDADELLEDELGAPMSDLVLQGRPTRSEIASAALRALKSGAEIVVLSSSALGNVEGDLPEVHEAIGELLNDGAVKIWLDADPRELMTRCGMDVARPASLGAPRALFLSQLKARTPLYSAGAERVDTTGKSVEEIGEALALRHSA